MGLLLKAEGLSGLLAIRLNEVEKPSRGGLVVGSKKFYILGRLYCSIILCSTGLNNPVRIILFIIA